ncbi:DNA double-strand break repair nuclease NurA [Candidatus Dependentiae bacterium]|nr:DNA double-strand break repair nuclease NurA [Candidatus Dependentiae bacterium]
MLKQDKILNQLESLAGQIFSMKATELEYAFNIFQKINSDKSFLTQIKEKNSNYQIPQFDYILNFSQKVDSNLSSYKIISTDGSQIYPDRHQGIGCFLINIGTVELTYSKDSSSVYLDSDPSIHFSPDILEQEMVNCMRSQKELEVGYERILGSEQKDILFLIDGSIISWHLESQNSKHVEYLEKFLATLEQFYKNNSLFAGYISLPQNKEIINILRRADESKKIEYLVDADIVNFFLKPFYITQFFVSNSPICKVYPEHLKPYFAYFNVGSEIVRIELPQFIVNDEAKLNFCISAILDQTIKGYGYPVALAEAHEQAVVKNFERDFFYQTLHKIAFNKNQKILNSQKSLKKKLAAI